MNDQTRKLARLRRSAARTALRLRLDDALRRAAVWLPLPLTYAVAALTAIKVLRPSPEAQGWIVLAGVLPVAIWVAAVVHAAVRRRPWYAGALALDRHHGHKDRITNALAFDRMGAEARTPLMTAAIEDAVATVSTLSPRRAAPLRAPKELLLSAGLMAAVYGISLLEVQTRRVVPPETDRFTPLVMSPDDLDLFREAAEQMAEESDDPKTQAAVRRFNRLVEDIAERRLDRREVFRQLEEIERDLAQASEADQAALDEAIAGLAQELDKSGDTKPAAEALARKDLKDAEEALKKLAERLKEKKPVDKKRLEELRKALEKASQANTKRAEQARAEREEAAEERRRLLKKKQEKGLSPDEQKRLEQLDRRLERLDRQKKQSDSARQQMSELDKELARAAAELMKDLGSSAEALEQAAQDLNRTAQKQMTQKEKEELKQRLEELRQLLRQQGQGGKERLRRLMRFGQRARGGQSGEGQEGQEGKNGKGKQGQGQEGGGKDGKGRDLVLRQGGSGSGVDVLMPGQGAPMPGPGGSQGEQGPGAGQGGDEWGQGHDPNVRGDKTTLPGQTQDVAAAGVDTGQGASTSEVIYTAADRGFVGRGYQKVFTDYQTVAEEVLKHDEVPPGFEFYVRRYFQLIRPRE